MLLLIYNSCKMKTTTFTFLELIEDLSVVLHSLSVVFKS